MSIQHEKPEKVCDTKSLVALLEEATTIGSETAVKMSEQTEQLHRIRGTTEQISNDLDIGAHFLRKLGMRRRLNKAIKTFTKTGAPPPPREEVEAQKVEMMKEKLNAAQYSTPEEPYEHHEVKPSVADIRLRTKNRTAKANAQGLLEQINTSPSSKLNDTGISPSSATPTVYTVPDIDPTSPEGLLLREQDDDLDRMSELLGTLKEIAIQQGKETETQSAQLDEISTNVEKSTIRTAAGSRAISMKYGIKWSLISSTTVRKTTGNKEIIKLLNIKS